MMCKFENVQMCRYGKHLLASFVIIVFFSCSVFGQSSVQFYQACKFTQLLSLQNFDSIAPLLSNELKGDSATKASITSAGKFVAQGQGSMYWVYERLDQNSITCSYIDRNNENRPQLL